MRNVHTQIKPAALIVLLFAQLGFTAHAAPLVPPVDAGQTMRDLQQQPDLTAPKEVPPLNIEGESAPKIQENEDVRLVVNAIRVSGSSVYTAAELEALLADLTGGEHLLAEIVDGIARITSYYRERGYIAVRAYLPPQEIRDGVVLINVLEGRLGEQRVHNQARLSDQHASDYLSAIQSGDVLQAAPVDRAILLLNDTPGVGAARATLQPGASVGTADLVIELDPSVPYSANLELDNGGNYYTGEYRLGAELLLNSPLGMGDLLTLNALTSDQDLSYARISYSMPAGGSGLKLGAAYSKTSYRVGKEFADLLSHGTATSSSLFATYPFMRSLAGNLFGTLTWEEKQLNDQSDALGNFSSKQVRLLSMGLNGNHQDALGGGGFTSFDMSLVSGSLSIDPYATELWTWVGYQYAKIEGNYTRLAYNVNRVQRLNDTDSLSGRLSGQRSSRNLNSSEQFSLGGSGGVRAYPSGEASGDQGWLLNLELRHSFAPAIQGVIFYDAGSVEISRYPSPSAGDNTRTISGAGIGANAELAGVQIKTYLAWRTDGGTPASEPDTLDRDPRLWLQLTRQF
jgi:hemolysin activation/secretion protein